MFSGSLDRFTQINSSSPASNGQKQQKDGHGKERQLHAIYVSTSAQQGIGPKAPKPFCRFAHRRSVWWYPGEPREQVT